MQIPDNLKIVVAHLHPRNSSRSRRRGSRYLTVAKGFDKDTGEHLATTFAKCGRHDAPNRKLGREIAVGRLLRALED
jgi:hypothetical protein